LTVGTTERHDHVNGCRAKIAPGGVPVTVQETVGAVSLRRAIGSAWRNVAPKRLREGLESDRRD
jgi:hypothetical protein